MFFDRVLEQWYPSFNAMLDTDTGKWITKCLNTPVHDAIPEYVRSAYIDIALEADKKVKQCRTVADAKEVLKEMSVAWVATLRLLGGDVRD